MIIDRQLPVYDVVVAEHLVVDDHPVTTFTAARELDLLTVRAPLMDAALWMRGLPDRLHRRLVPPMAQLRLAQGVGLPGWGKIACNFTVVPSGGGTLLTYECRTATTDPVSRRRFARYWWLIRPLAAYIMRAALGTIAAEAVRRQALLAAGATRAG
jgi:hypothetical protein